jgi:hypothetical protein
VQRLFTLEQARTLLPQIREIAGRMRELKATLDRHHAAFAFLAPRAEGEPHLIGALEYHRTAIQRLVADIQRHMEAVHALGAEVKGIEQGLVDFPSKREGRVVYLCWMIDEPDIAWWHELEAGFRGRQPL